MVASGDPRFRMLVEHAADLLIEVDAAGTLILANPAFLAAVGAGSDRVIGHPLWDWVHPDDLDATLAIFRAGISTGDPQRAQFRLGSWSGGWVTVSATGAPYRADTGALRAIGVLRIVDELATTRQALHDAMRVLDAVPVVAAVLDESLTVISLNRAARDQTGLDQDGMIGAPVRALARHLCGEDAADAFVEALTDAIGRFQGGGPCGATRFSYGEGEAGCTVLINASSIPIVSGHHHVVTITDITSEARATAQALRSEAQLTAILDSEPECVKVLDHEGRLVFMNPAGLAMVAADSLDQVRGLFVSELVTPEDRERFQHDIARVLAGESVVSEFEILGLDGIRRRVRQHATPFRGEGTPAGAIQVLAVTHDVTARHQAESEERATRDLLRAVIDATTDWIFVKDLDYRFILVNRAFASAQGLTPNEMIGRPDTDFWTKEACEGDSALGIRGYHQDDRVAFGGETARNEYDVATFADGTIHVFETIKTPLRNSGGDIYGVLGYSRDVTERRRSEENVRLSEGLLKEAQRLARMGNWVLDLVANELTWSDTVFEIAGVDRATFQPSFEGILELVHPEDRSLLVEAYSESLRTRKPYLLTHRLLWPDGSVRWLEERAESEFGPDGTPLRSIGTVQDVTEQVMLRAAADRAVRELAQIVEASPLPIVLADEQGIIVSVNSATARTFAWDADALVGQNVAILAPDFSESQHDAFIQNYRDTGTASTAGGLVIGRTREVRARRSDGTEFPADLTVADITQADGSRRFVGILLDRTEWRAREEQVIRIQKLDAVGTLIAGVAHDFNNLLTAILGGIEMSLTRPDEPHWPNLARQAAERASDLVQRLLRFSRQEAPQRSAVQPRAIAEAVLAIARETIDRRIWITADIDEALPDVFADAGQIEQVLLNLVINGRDAVLERADRSGGEYRPAIRIAIEGRLRGDVRGVVFTIEDNGVGMPDEVRSRAFDPFYTTKAADRGTGLGLSIVSGIVASHDGSIDLDSKLGTGTSFKIWLPAVRADAAEAGGDFPDDASPADPSSELGVAGRVLLVDDEVMIGEVAQAYLATAGLKVTLLNSGAEAIRIAESVRFDIAVIDLNMPPPDGWEVLDALRRLDPDLPVVVASGFAAESDVIERGGIALIHKPYRREELVGLVSEILGRPKGSGLGGVRSDREND